MRFRAFITEQIMGETNNYPVPNIILYGSAKNKSFSRK